MTTKSKALATRKYEEKNYDKVLLRLKKGGETSKENIQEHAKRAGESLNGYITKAVKMRIEKEN